MGNVQCNGQRTNHGQSFRLDNTEALIKCSLTTLNPQQSSRRWSDRFRKQMQSHLESRGCKACCLPALRVESNQALLITLQAAPRATSTSQTTSSHGLKMLEQALEQGLPIRGNCLLTNQIQPILFSGFGVLTYSTSNTC
jgi:hypothetical protein